MGNYKCRKENYLKGWQIDVAQYMFQGLKDEDIIKKVFYPREEMDKRMLANGRNRLRNLRNNPKFMEYYKSIITEWSVHYVGKALNKLGEQIDCGLPWLENKAANDVIAQAKKAVLGEDDNTVHVHIEGMPELGSPDDGGD